jgi:hypothetical protein
VTTKYTINVPYRVSGKFKKQYYINPAMVSTGYRLQHCGWSKQTNNFM